MNIELLNQAIEDAKAVNCLCLSWDEEQFGGIVGWDNVSKNTTKRVSCHCKYCKQTIKLEESSSHASICKNK